MEHEDEALTQLTTRIPKRLHVAIETYCVRAEQSMMDFVEAAMREKLRRSGGRQG